MGVVRLAGGVLVCSKVEDARWAALREGQGDGRRHVVTVDEVDGRSASGAGLAGHPLDGMAIWTDEASQPKDGGVRVVTHGAFGCEEAPCSRGAGERATGFGDGGIAGRLGVHASAACMHEVWHAACTVREALIRVADGVSKWGGRHGGHDAVHAGGQVLKVVHFHLVQVEFDVAIRPAATARGDDVMAPAAEVFCEMASEPAGADDEDV